jgi:putative spermidine/putrescine transport system permease protein
VTLPLIAPGIVSGAVLAFITSFDEVVIAIFVSGARAPTLPKQMWDGIRTEIDPTVAAVSTLLIFVTAGLVGALTLIRRRADRERV